jgi:epoxyqueuosine reductase QueG
VLKRKFGKGGKVVMDLELQVPAKVRPTESLCSICHRICPVDAAAGLGTDPSFKPAQSSPADLPTDS